MNRPYSLIPSHGPADIRAGRRTARIVVRNRGDRAIQVDSRSHFYDVTYQLFFDRSKAVGMRLDIPAGATLSFEPGGEKEVLLVNLLKDNYVGRRVQGQDLSHRHWRSIVPQKYLEA